MNYLCSEKLLKLLALIDALILVW